MPRTTLRGTAEFIIKLLDDIEGGNAPPAANTTIN
jgi:hypothetical protein